MVIKVGINGFGRVGRVVFRTCLEHPDVEVCAINDPAIEVDYICYLIKFDSTHGTLRGDISYTEDTINVNDLCIKVFQEKFPTGIPWHTAGAEYIVEASGLFTNMEKASGHLLCDGVRTVIVTAPCVDVPMVILGVNDANIKSDKNIISCGSSTLYCLAPIVKVLEDNYGIEEGFITSIHAMTPSLKPLDGLCLKGKHWRDHRSITQNIIPAATGACKALGRIIPSVRDRICGLAFRVPIANVSVLDLTVKLKKTTSIVKIAQDIEMFSQTTKNIIKTNYEEAVSSDFIGDCHSCILDIGSSIQLKADSFKLICWYENEYSYACRVIDLILHCETQLIEMKSQKNQGRRCFIPVPIKEISSKQQTFAYQNRDRPKRTLVSAPLTNAKARQARLKRGVQNPIQEKGHDSRMTLCRIWNDEIAKVRQKPTAFLQASPQSPPFTKNNATCEETQQQPLEKFKQDNLCTKAQERLEKVKKEFSKMVNITENLLQKSCSGKVNLDAVENRASIKTQKNTADQNHPMDAPTNSNNYSSINSSLENCSNTLSNFNNSKSGEDRSDFSLPNSSRIGSMIGSFASESIKDVDAGNFAFRNRNKISKNIKPQNSSNTNDCFIENTFSNLIDGLSSSQLQNTGNKTIYSEHENQSEEGTNETEIYKSAFKKTNPMSFNEEITVLQVMKMDTDSRCEMDSIKEEPDHLSNVVNEQTQCDKGNTMVDKPNSNKDVDLYDDHDKHITFIEDDDTKYNNEGTEVVSYGYYAKSEVAETGSRASSFPYKQDIYDKLDSESASDTGSNNSFDVHNKKSQIINISDITTSLEDLDRLDKICKIMEISDELSDKLLSALNNNPNDNDVNISREHWSFKDLCEKVNLDEFCNQIFGK